MRKRLPKEPSWKAMLFTAMSGASIGAMIAVAMLIMKPPSTVNEMPDGDREQEIGKPVVYFQAGVVGDPNDSRTRSGVSRLESGRGGQTIKFTEGQVNGYLKNYKTPATNPDGSAASATISNINVRFEQDQIVASLKLTLNYTDSPWTFIAQAYCNVSEGEKGTEFSIDEVYVNSLKLPGVGGIIMKTLVNRLNFDEGIENSVFKARKIVVTKKNIVFLL